MKAVLKGLAVVSVLLLLNACTASSRIVKTYEGDSLSEGQVARITIPDDIELLLVDGVSQKKYLLNNLSLTYELVPGEHVLVYRYASLWTVPGVRSSQAPTEVVTSPKMEIRYNFQAGQKYRLEHSEPDNRTDAKLYADSDFTGKLVSVTGAILETGIPHQPGAEIVDAAEAESPVVAAVPTVTAETPTSPASAEAAVVSSAPVVDGDLPRLEALKVLWGQTTAEDKKAFLRWAFE